MRQIGRPHILFDCLNIESIVYGYIKPCDRHLKPVRLQTSTRTILQDLVGALMKIRTARSFSPFFISKTNSRQRFMNHGIFLFLNIEKQHHHRRTSITYRGSQEDKFSSCLQYCSSNPSLPITDSEHTFKPAAKHLFDIYRPLIRSNLLKYPKMVSVPSSGIMPPEQPWGNLLRDLILTTESALEGGLELKNENLYLQLDYWRHVFSRFQEAILDDHMSSPYLTEPPLKKFVIYFHDSIHSVRSNVSIELNSPWGVYKIELLNALTSCLYGNAGLSENLPSDGLPWTMGPGLKRSKDELGRPGPEDGKATPALIYGLEWTEDGSECSNEDPINITLHCCPPEHFIEKKALFEGEMMSEAERASQ